MSQVLQLPWESDSSVRWFSVLDYATRWRRSPRTIRRWCVDGTLSKFGCKVYRDPQERWWVGEPLTVLQDNKVLPATVLTT